MTQEQLDAVRYPVGKFVVNKASDASTRARWIDEIAHAPEHVAALVSRLNQAQLTTPYREGGWTVAQVVHHMADSHMNAYLRTKWAVSETGFVVKPYDEKTWAEMVDARDPDVSPSLDILRGVHKRWVRLLHSLGTDEFELPLLHPERGPMTVDALVQLYAWHGRHHAAHIAGARTRDAR